MIEAAHRSELARLHAGVPDLLETLLADVALGTWMDPVLISAWKLVGTL